MRYIDNLVGQFIKANGIPKYDINSREFLREFSDWIQERQRMGNDYISLLEDMGISVNTFTTVEVGKTSFDSIVKNRLTTIITPYVFGFERNLKLIESSFDVDNLGNIRIHNNKDELLLLRRYMMHNPYNERCLNNWDKLHNFKSNIIVGIYGKENDKDIIRKIVGLNNFRELLNDEIIEEETNYNNTYCKVIASKQLVKK